MLRSIAFPRGVPQLHTEAAGTAPPDAFGSFRVLHQIGAGALGPVFRAYEPDQDRLVAVKWFQLDLAPERVHQLIAEFDALVARDLEHPSIARPRAAGIAGARPYLVQDFVAADSVDIVLRDHGPAPLAEAVRVATQLAAALDRASAVGVLHGALHPRDVLVGGEEARLTGLGVAQALERIGMAIAARRPYTAPERAAGAAWDRRADIFSLAAVIYELISGKRITATGLQAAEAFAGVAGADAAGLGKVFARALADDPHERFESAAAFAETLTEAAGPEPVAARRRPGAAVEPVVEMDLRLPLEEPVVSEVEPFDIAKVLAPADDLDLTITRPPLNPLNGVNPVNPVNPDMRRVALERNRSAVWPLALAVVIGLAVGLAVGFAGGYNVASRGDESAAADAPAAAATAPSREFTDVPVTAPAPAAPAIAVATNPAPAARSPAPAAPKPEARNPRAAPPRPPAVRSTPAARGSVPRAPARPPAVAATPPPSRGTGGLLVDSRPAGVNVFVDNKLIGTTPLVLDTLAAGEHSVRLERDGYQRWISSVRIVSGERSRVAASLER